MNKKIIEHELNLFFSQCQQFMKDIKRDWDFVIDWSENYLKKRNQSEYAKDKILDHIERLEAHFGHGGH